MIRVLVVDDHPVLRAGLEAVLRAEPGFVCVGVAADGAEMSRVLHRDGARRRRARPPPRRRGRARAVRDRALEPDAPEVVIYTADDSARHGPPRRAPPGRAAPVAKERDIGELFDALRLAVRRRAEVDALR
jgi:hypothetical protein